LNGRIGNSQQSDKLDTDPHHFADDNQNVWNMSLFGHFFMVEPLFESWIRIRIKVTSRIRIQIKVAQIRNTGPDYELASD
jgi:hypothetical protein